MEDGASATRIRSCVPVAVAAAEEKVCPVRRFVGGDWGGDSHDGSRGGAVGVVAFLGWGDVEVSASEEVDDQEG